MKLSRTSFVLAFEKERYSQFCAKILHLISLAMSLMIRQCLLLLIRNNLPTSQIIFNALLVNELQFIRIERCKSYIYIYDNQFIHKKI